MIEVADFLPENTYKQLKRYSLACEFKDAANPIDGVTYPAISIDIPEHIVAEVLSSIGQTLGFTPTDPIMFLRMSMEGEPCPHVHHHDLSHGTYSLMLYLNNDERGGTSLVRHGPSGCMYAPFDKDISAYIQSETNKLDRWVPYHKSNAVENSAAIFDAGLMHRAEPVGGFGTSQDNARIVLTCFFS